MSTFLMSENSSPKYFICYFRGFQRRELITTPQSPPSQGGDEGEVFCTIKIAPVLLSY